MGRLGCMRLTILMMRRKVTSTTSRRSLSNPAATAASNACSTAAKGTNDAPGAGNERLLISLEPSLRDWLHQRIAQRFDAMLEAGFVAEVQALRARADLHPDLPAMRCVGYRQAWQALDGQWPMAELRDKGVFATRQLAKRQLTWLRALAGRRVVACDAPDALQQVLTAAKTFAESRT